MEKLRVSCLVNRNWDIDKKCFCGDKKDGSLIEISCRTENGCTIPVGVVIFDDHSIEDIPLEFIEEKTEI